jgi:hypothetical protein
MLFYLNNQEKDKIQEVPLITLADINWTEGDLENLIVTNISTLISENQLMVFFQERSFQEEADIYALNKKGDLYLFELKRWRSEQENILQVLRYGQIYGQYTYEQLQNLLRKYEDDSTIDLSEKHFEYFTEEIERKLEPEEFNKDQYFVVITDGTDFETLSAINYWKNKGLKIESIVYRVYKVGERLLFNFNPFGPENEVLLEGYDANYIVNTNVTWSKTNYKDMLDNGKASAYGDRRYGIENIRNGNTVFLYHTGVGIVAYGQATNDCQKGSNNRQEDEEYFVELKFEWKIDPDKEPMKAITAFEINSKLNSGYRFRQTVFSISQEMADTIKELKTSKK